MISLNNYILDVLTTLKIFAPFFFLFAFFTDSTHVASLAFVINNFFETIVIKTVSMIDFYSLDMSTRKLGVLLLAEMFSFFFFLFIPNMINCRSFHAPQRPFFESSSIYNQECLSTAGRWLDVVGVLKWCPIENQRSTNKILKIKSSEVICGL